MSKKPRRMRYLDEPSRKLYRKKYKLNLLDGCIDTGNGYEKIELLGYRMRKKRARISY